MSKKSLDRELAGAILDLKKLVADNVEMVINKQSVFIKVEKIIWNKPGKQTIPIRFNIFANKIPYNYDVVTVVKVDPVEIPGIHLGNLFKLVKKAFVARYAFEKGA